MWKQFLEKLACKHEWENIESIEVRYIINDNITNLKYLYLCKKCGKFKKITM
jgi:hypothetical protein